jgi:Domain of unknown function (DUF202)
VRAPSGFAHRPLGCAPRFRPGEARYAAGVSKLCDSTAMAESFSSPHCVCRSTIEGVTPWLSKNFSDHAANERTFLAWVRTAIAVMAFGFLVEKFDLFFRFASASLGRGAPAFRTGRLAGWSGLALIVLGLAIVANADMSPMIFTAEAGPIWAGIFPFGGQGRWTREWRETVEDQGGAGRLHPATG